MVVPYRLKFLVELSKTRCTNRITIMIHNEINLKTAGATNSDTDSASETKDEPKKVGRPRKQLFYGMHSV
jgi:hypothetical protein